MSRFTGSRLFRIGCIVFILGISAANAIAATRYVGPGGSDTAPYDSWANAASNIQTAVDYADPGDLILVTNGVYTIDTTGFIVTIDKAITLQSVNGPDVTIIDALAGTTSTQRHSLYLNAENALVSGFTMQGTYFRNTSTGNSAVRILAGTVSNCVIRANWTIGGVGGVYISGGRLVDSEVRENESTEWQNGRGGGIHLTGGLVERCLIVDNQTSCWRGGAGVYMTGGTLRNNVIVNNQATFFRTVRDPLVYHGAGAGVWMNNGTVENCTITGNNGMGSGSGLRADGGTIVNTIVYDNTTTDRVPVEEWDVRLSGAATLTYSCTPYVSGTGNTADPPEFRDPTGGDYRLLPGSACINAGTTRGDFAEDFDGTARPIDAAWDIGVYETPLPGDQPFTANFIATPRTGLNSANVNFNSYFAGANTNITWYRWQLGDGTETSGTDLDTISHTYAPGFYDVTLTVSNAVDESTSETKSAYIKIYPMELYVSTNGAHTFPFDTPAKAANDIASAVAAAPNASNAVVWVDDGTWEMAEQVRIEKALQVRSVNGPTNTTTIVPGNHRSFYLHHPDVMVDGFKITTSSAGSAHMSGAGVYMLQGTVTNCVFEGIHVGGRGAAIWMAGGRVADSIIRDNSAKEWQNAYGGGIYIENYPHFGVPLVDNCHIINNECWSRRGGGGIYMQAGIIRNSLIVSNTATYVHATNEDGTGGGVKMLGGTLENCTVTRNFSIDSGGGVYIDGAATIINSIIYDNTVDVAPDGERNLFNAGGTVTYSCVAPAPSGTGNIGLDPMFVDPDALNFRLDPASPAVDKGLNLPWMDGAVDLDGNPRIENEIVDMGCYEAPDPWSGPLIAGFSASPSAGLMEIEAVFTAEPVGLNTEIVHYAWDLGDGTIISGPDKAVVTNSYSAGYYDISITMKNEIDETASVTRDDYIKVAPAFAYVATNGTAVPPYLSLETAAASVQDALAVVNWDETGAHTVVAVTNGTYYVGGQIILSTNYTIMGLSSNVEDVILQGTQSRLFNISHPGVTLSGLTIAGGDNTTHTYHGGGIYMTDGVVTNCIIRDNRAGGHGGGIYQSGGLVTDCLFFENNASEWNYGQGGGLRISGSGLAENCVFDANTTGSRQGGGGLYVAGGTVRNALVMHNTATRTTGGNESPGGGVVVVSGIFESSTVVTNWSIVDGGGIYQTGGTVRNVIVVDNYVTLSGASDWHNPTATYSMSPDLAHDPQGTGNLSDTPIFVDAEMLNFELDHNSPGIDAGHNQAWMIDAIDLAGNPRISRGEHSERVDMGAYEYIRPLSGTILMIR